MQSTSMAGADSNLRAVLEESCSVENKLLSHFRFNDQHI
jgi:hypothetical protein